jgi:hypothetical protein
LSFNRYLVCDEGGRDIPEKDSEKKLNVGCYIGVLGSRFSASIGLLQGPNATAILNADIYRPSLAGYRVCAIIKCYIFWRDYG